MLQPTLATNGPEAKFIRGILRAKIIAENYDPQTEYDIFLDGQSVDFVSPHNSANLHRADIFDARGHLIGPSLCHAHIHLDKCFLLNDSKFADLAVEVGDFAEALHLTTQAKSRFEEDDLLRRGRWLIEESVRYGVTHMRAFVEVDQTVEFKCLDAAIKLKNEFRDVCHIQICAFAQDPMFSGDAAGRNRTFMESASRNLAVEAIGTTPYVEDSNEHVIDNITWAVESALRASPRRKHLDLHLDYNLNHAKPSMVDTALDIIKKQYITDYQNAQITLGHCTRLTLFNDQEWQHLGNACSGLPIHFVGLPTSDMFIMGKPNRPDVLAQDRVRGTLQIPHLIRRYGLSGAISINNVGNAFTPYGNCDPLSVASMGVGIYQAGTKQDTALLYDCVAGRAKAATGLCIQNRSPFAKGSSADFVIYGNLGGSEDASAVRGRDNVAQLIYDPAVKRATIFQGCLVSG